MLTGVSWWGKNGGGLTHSNGAAGAGVGFMGAIAAVW